ncbi:MAG: hypothetical protein QXL17_07610 [Candidatus Thermoplasmatota archaeon]
MWLITTLFSALITTALWMKAPKKYHFEIPMLMFWGSTIMIFIDHLLGYDGDSFVTLETEGIVSNSIILGILMILPVLAVWGIYLLIKKQKPTTQLR